MNITDRLDDIEARNASKPLAEPVAGRTCTFADELVITWTEDTQALINALRAVLDVHTPDGHDVCGEADCYASCDYDGDAWPCPTVRAITDALGGEQA